MKYWEVIADLLHAEGWSYGIAEHLTKGGFRFAHFDHLAHGLMAEDVTILHRRHTAIVKT